MEHNMKECPINHTFKLVGKKFTMLIIRNMIHRDHKRFNQFLEIEDINAKVLSARLKEMEEDYKALGSMKITILLSRIADFKSPFASLAFPGATTLIPGICVNQASRDCEC